VLVTRATSLAIALFLCAGVVVQSQDQNAEGATTNAQAEKQQARSYIPPVVVNVLATPKSEEERKREQQDRDAKAEHEKKIAEYERKLADATDDLAQYTRNLSWFTAALVFLGLIQLGVFGYQSRQLRRTVDAAENESMPFLFPVVVDRAAGLKPPLTTYRHTGITGLPASETFPYKPSIRVVFDNYGKTPAIVRSFKGELWIAARLPNGPEYDSRTETRKFVAVIPAQTTHDANAPPPHLPTPISMHDEISLSEWAALNSKADVGLRFFLIGEVIYDDFFERRHTFGFCIKVFPGGNQWLSGPPPYHYIRHSSARKGRIEPNDEETET
jgi:hypothetical protein